MPQQAQQGNPPVSYTHLDVYKRQVFSAEDAEEKVKDEAWKKVVLVRLETSPEDIVGMQVSQGILTVRGGMTSHAAVVARGMGTCCVSGCGNDNDVAIDYDAKVITINGHTFHEGDWMSIDGSTGNIYEGQIATVASTENANFKRFMSWADEARQMKVMTNADNPRDAPVSYTHLDVYKRQISPRTENWPGPSTWARRV